MEHPTLPSRGAHEECVDVGFGSRQLRDGSLLEPLVLLASVCVCVCVRAEFCVLRVGCADDDMSLTCLGVQLFRCCPSCG